MSTDLAQLAADAGKKLKLDFPKIGGRHSIPVAC
jgi:hypothetical protein